MGLARRGCTQAREEESAQTTAASLQLLAPTRRIAFLVLTRLRFELVFDALSQARADPDAERGAERSSSCRFYEK